MATADIDFMALGKHCNVPGCHQLDFLPITCTLCKLVTCSFHGTNHGCVNSEIKDVRTIRLSVFILCRVVFSRSFLFCSFIVFCVFKFCRGAFRSVLCATSLSKLRRLACR
eukprot:m.423966 g.423966  ORF g.423966 m.423966 type:complete len:111 (+) comp56668_c0_seq5:116-448(+)